MDNSLANPIGLRYASRLQFFLPIEGEVTIATAKTIQIYLPTGELCGIRIADITTRLVLAVLIPAAVLLGRSANGRIEWNDEDGRH